MNYILLYTNIDIRGIHKISEYSSDFTASYFYQLFYTAIKANEIKKRAHWINLKPQQEANKSFLGHAVPIFPLRNFTRKITSSANKKHPPQFKVTHTRCSLLFRLPTIFLVQTVIFFLCDDSLYQRYRLDYNLPTRNKIVKTEGYTNAEVNKNCQSRLLF